MHKNLKKPNDAENNEKKKKRERINTNKFKRILKN